MSVIIRPILAASLALAGFTGSAHAVLTTFGPTSLAPTSRPNVFNNVINGVDAVPAFVDGWTRLDQQIYQLPAAYANETLVSMRFTDLNLGNPTGSAFITAATVAVAPVPEPASALLLLSGGLALLAWRWRAGV